MLANAAIVEAVAADARSSSTCRSRRRPGDDRQGRPSAARGRRRRRAEGASCLPRAHVVTPNIPEAEVLTGLTIRIAGGHARGGGANLRARARASYSSRAGIAEGPESIDVACLRAGTFELRGPRLSSRNTHGTGCTLSSAIAANLAQRPDRGGRRSGRRVGTSKGRLRNAPGLGAGPRPAQPHVAVILRTVASFR